MQPHAEHSLEYLDGRLDMHHAFFNGPGGVSSHLSFFCNRYGKVLMPGNLPIRRSALAEENRTNKPSSGPEYWRNQRTDHRGLSKSANATSLLNKTAYTSGTRQQQPFNVLYELESKAFVQHARCDRESVSVNTAHKVHVQASERLLTPRMSREQTAELFASRATEGSALDSLVRHLAHTPREAVFRKARPSGSKDIRTDGDLVQLDSTASRLPLEDGRPTRSLSVSPTWGE